MFTKSSLALAGLAILGGANALIAPASAAEPATFREKVLYSFAGEPDGLFPYDSLVDVNGMLYGTTTGGGASNSGTVFAFDPTTDTETVLHSFNGGTDGGNSYATLIAVNGKLYGTTDGGGASNFGTVFTIDPNTGTETVVYSFGSGTDGQYPQAGLVNSKGTLYGTTAFGGSSGNGTVFALDPNTGAETVLHSFAGGTDGASPHAALIGVNGTLYGTTTGGGTANNGTVFAIDRKTGTEAVLHSFAGGTTDGAYPYASLIAVNGTLYGTTGFGGAYCETGEGIGCGTAFSVDPNTGAEKVFHHFGSGTDGQNPYAGMINVKGVLYGTTAAGGSNCLQTGGCGTAFKLDPTNGAEKVIYSFSGGTDASNPRAGLLALNGRLYGMSVMGGAHNAGTVFSLKKKR